MEELTKPLVTPVERKPRAEVWKLAKGACMAIPTSVGILEITNANINKPSVINVLTMHERQTGKQLFNVVFVKG
jgi:hypothetical protein